VLAEVTPPVALSAYAAAAVMGTDPIKTGVFAARVAVPKYLIGITFILSTSGTALLIIPVLQTMPLNQAVIEIVMRYFLSFLAVFCLNVAVVGHFIRDISKLERCIVGAAALILFYPSNESDWIGSIIVIGFMLIKWIQNRRAARLHLPSK
jgi:TRAP-type uncharacterized transport system fused permease subunit